MTVSGSAPTERKRRCASLSPIYKFDAGPCQCELEDGHPGSHSAKEPPEHRVVGQPIYSRTWKEARS